MFTSDGSEEDSEGSHEGGFGVKGARSQGGVEVVVGSVHAPARVTIRMTLLPLQKRFATIGPEECEDDLLREH